METLKKCIKKRHHKRTAKSLAKRKDWKIRKSKILLAVNTEHSYSLKEMNIERGIPVLGNSDSISIHLPTIIREKGEEDVIMPCSNGGDVKETTIDCDLVETELHEFSFISENEYESVLNHELETEKDQSLSSTSIEGHRIVDLNYVLKWSMSLQLDHSKKCTLGTLQLVEEDCNGFISTLKFRCDTCDYEITKSTHDPKKSPNKSINYKAVWGTLSIGSTHTKLKELLGVIGIPCMSYRLFQRIELELGNAWKERLWLSMEKAGKEEREIALAIGDIDNSGTPWITVFLDGGWSHRSYGHSYNASSGVAVIIGKATGKLLFLGVRNKYCTVCARAFNKGEEVSTHICYKNWVGSSSAMEASIIVEGFKLSQETHGVKYLKIIADGDSSVYSKLRKEVPYGNNIEKIECKNHAIKNYGKSLYSIKKDTKVQPEARKLLSNIKIKELQSICMKILYINAHGEVEQLKKDLHNGPFHVFGDHRKCRSVYCANVGESTNSTMAQVHNTGLYFHINSSLERLIAKGHKVIDNETNNRAEMYMSILCKFNAGKRLNLAGRGSFERRSVLTGLRYNEGVQWQQEHWKNIFGYSPEIQLKKIVKNNKTALENKARRRLYMDPTCKRKKKGIVLPSSSKNNEYGPNAEQPLLSDEEYDSEKLRLLSSLKVSQSEIRTIERQTVGQWSNSLYKDIRRYRLTASTFGIIYKRRDNTSCLNLIKSLMNPQSFENEFTMYGKEKESVARLKFAATCPQAAKVEECGIFIDAYQSHLAASPDGIIGKNGILEIKCLLKVHKSGLTLFEAAQKWKTLPVEVVENQLRLKRNHNYYYQVQGQLNIAQKDICFFIIYINDSEPLFIEAIEKDETLWSNMVLKLNNFYFNCLLPKLVDKNKPCFNKQHKNV